MINKFNDIISDEVFLVLPDQIESSYDYKDIINKAFDLTNGVLDFGDISILEEGKYFRFKVISKGIETNFRLNANNNYSIDILNLVRGLNKALTDIFYLGNERFYSIGGSVIPYGVGFISSKQKRTLQKEGLIGTNILYFNSKKDDIPKMEVTEINNVESVIEVERIKGESITPEKHFSISKKQKRILKKLENKTLLRLFEIIHYPNENSSDTVAMAKIIGIEKSVPIFDDDEFVKLKLRHRRIIETFSNKKNRNLIPSLLKKLDLERKTRIMILSEAQRNIKTEKDNPSFWKVILGLTGFRLVVILTEFFDRKD